jgi:hypothetical protein
MIVLQSGLTVLILRRTEYYHIAYQTVSVHAPFFSLDAKMPLCPCSLYHSLQACELNLFSSNEHKVACGTNFISSRFSWIVSQCLCDKSTQEMTKGSGAFCLQVAS